MKHSEIWVAACTVLAMLSPLALLGLALINAGFTRTRAVMHVIYASLIAIAIAALSYISIGFVWQGAPGVHGHLMLIGSKPWDVLGSGPFFLKGVDPGSSDIVLRLLFGLSAVSLCSLIPIGAASERWRLGPTLLSVGLFAAFVFPVYAHWSWTGEWLDTGGSGSIHSVGGLWALSVVWITGARRGKYSSSGMPTATPGHSAPYVLAGCLLALAGWFGINGSGALLLAAQDIAHLPYLLLNTVAGAVGGLISSAFITRVRFGKPDASLCANGWMSGLVAGSAGCTVFRVPEAVLVGLISGTLVVFAIEVFELRLKVDDPGGAISVHAIGGLWGLIAAGIFGGQLVAQLCGVSLILGIMFPATYGLNALLNRFVRYRVGREGERQGLDLHELGSGAYPEFVIHRDDSMLR